MKKKLLMGVLTVILVMTTSTQGVTLFAKDINKQQIESDAVEPLLEKQLSATSKHFELDFSSLDVVITNNDVKLVDNPGKLQQSHKALKVPDSYKENLIGNARKDFTRSETNKYLKNKSFKKDLISLVNNIKSQNGTLIQVGITIDSNDQMEPKSTAIANKSSIPTSAAASSFIGGTTYNSDSSCALWVSVSYSGYSDLWVQSNLNWNGTQTAGGRDFIGIEWDQNWVIKTSSDKITSIITPGGVPGTNLVLPVRAAFNGKNLVYSFVDAGSNIFAATGIYMGATLSGGPTGLQSFRAQYTHTYSSINYTCSLASSGPGFSVSPSISQYTLVSYVSPTIYRQL